MTDDVKGLCLFLGVIGLGYVVLLAIVALLTGAKVLKSILLISAFSSFLVSVGLTQQVKTTLQEYLRSLTPSTFA